MRVGLFTALLANLSLDEVIQKVRPLGIRTLELGTGNYPGEPHLKLEWLNQASKLKEFKQKLEDEGFSISALSCHGNPLHPNKKIAQLHAATSRDKIQRSGTEYEAGSGAGAGTRAPLSRAKRTAFHNLLQKLREPAAHSSLMAMSPPGLAPRARVNLVASAPNLHRSEAKRV